jgi:hypothetical protein
MPSKPRPRGPKPTHFTGFGAGDSVSEFLDSFDKEIKEKLRGPFDWIADRYADDFEMSLKINALPPQGVPQEALDDYETGSIPGGGFISLDIDPRKWIGIGQRGKKWLNEDGTVNRDKEAPKKMIKKTLTNWAKSAMQFQDLETMARSQFWEEILKNEYSPSEHTGLQNALYKMIAGKEPEEIFELDEMGKPKKDLETGKKIRNADVPANPYSLNDKGVYENVTKTKIYKQDETGNDLLVNGEKVEAGEIETQSIFTDSSDQVLVTERVSLIGAKPLEKSTLRTVDKATRDKWKFLPSTKDVYEEGIVPVRDFRRRSRSPLLRDPAHDLANSKLTHAAAVEMKFQNALIKKATGTADVNVASFVERSELTPVMGDLGKTIFDANRDVRQNILADVGLGRSFVDKAGKLHYPLLENIQEQFKNVEQGYNKLEGAYSLLDKSTLIRKHGADFVADLDTSMKNLKKIISSDKFIEVLGAKSPKDMTSKVADILKEINTSPGIMTILKGGGITGGFHAHSQLTEKGSHRPRRRGVFESNKILYRKVRPGGSQERASSYSKYERRERV